MQNQQVADADCVCDGGVCAFLCPAGEVFVLDDGGEVDLDLGNYERFLDIRLTKDNNLTTGKIYQYVINKERKGDYLGKTVQGDVKLCFWCLDRYSVFLYWWDAFEFHLNLRSFFLIYAVFVTFWFEKACWCKFWGAWQSLPVTPPSKPYSAWEHTACCMTYILGLDPTF